MYTNAFEKLRKEANKTKREVSAYLSMTVPTYTKYESGAAIPDLSMIGKLAAYYNITICDLLDQLKDNYKHNTIKIPVYKTITADTPVITSKNIMDDKYEVYKADGDPAELTEADIEDVKKFFKIIKEKRIKENN